MDIIAVLSQELSVSKTQIESAVKLMDEGNTIPFIARYRKEVTGGLDDTILRNLEERLHYLRNLEKRKQEVLELIAASGKLDDKQMEQMQKALEEAKMLSEVEDLYRPYKQKRKTRASVAREKGLEPLAKFMLMQKSGGDLEQEAARYVNAEKGVEDVEQVLSGAGDILAEEISDSAQIRSRLREYLQKNAQISTTKGTKENQIYDMYSEYSESVRRIAPHRILAIDRGEREEALKVSVEIDQQVCIGMIENQVIHRNSPFAKALHAVCEDSFKRLIFLPWNGNCALN